LISINSFKQNIRKRFFPSVIKEHEVVEAYGIWAENYDSQPGNLMLDLDQIVFSNLLKGIDIRQKDVADIGCGTGRHWPAIFRKAPASLTGFDVSPGMLGKLKEKFHEANTHVITDNSFSAIPNAVYDVIVSTLTVAHIENIEEAINTWCRLLKPKGDIIITDFHPDALASGGQRTFKHKNGHIAVKNFSHATNIIKDILLKNGFTLVSEEEKKVDESVKHYYAAQNALHVYDQFKGFSIIYGIHFRRA
jgi:ubiquinone/menaquinone biosynthesis C-methylase UbiE